MADSTDAPPEITQTLANMQQYYHQLPNKRFLFMRLKMRLYCSTNPTDSSTWARFWRNQGEPPVIYDPYAAQRTATQIATLLKTKGCFNSTVTTDTIHYGDNSLIARYNITATPRRKIDDITFSCRQPDVDSILKSWKDESLLKVGDYYDQQIMTQEQNRIASRLKDSGYYHVTPDLVRFYVDTTYDSTPTSAPHSTVPPANSTPSFSPTVSATAPSPTTVSSTTKPSPPPLAPFAARSSSAPAKPTDPSFPPSLPTPSLASTILNTSTSATKNHPAATTPLPSSTSASASSTTPATVSPSLLKSPMPPTSVNPATSSPPATLALEPL